MNNTEEIFSLLSTCFSICIVLSVLFFIIAVILFFVFDIRTIFNIRTGRAKKKTVSEMQAANNKTGRMKENEKEPVLQTDNSSTAILTNINSDNGQQQAALSLEAAQTDILNKEYAATDILDDRYKKNNYFLNSAPTMQLVKEKNTENNCVANGTASNYYDIGFTISKKIVIIHTNETIY